MGDTMVLIKDVERVYARLMREDCTHLSIDGFQVAVCIFDEGQRLSLSTSVFDEQGFIPPSVRRVIGRETPTVRFNVPTYPIIDEESGTVRLCHVGHVEHLDIEDFKYLLEEFVAQAEVWVHFLHDKGEPDLIYIPVR
jgi:hypothetical protein